MTEGVACLITTGEEGEEEEEEGGGRGTGDLGRDLGGAGRGVVE